MAMDWMIFWWGRHASASSAGKTTVVFGSNQTGAWGTGTLNLTAFADGQRGFVLQGQAGDDSGSSVSSAGDINGDGLDDILVGRRLLLLVPEKPRWCLVRINQALGVLAH